MMIKNESLPIPEHLRPRKEEKSQLFEKSWMEKITRTSLIVPVVMHNLIALSFLYYAIAEAKLQPLVIAVLFVCGAITWTLTEYWVHRVGYHCQTSWKWLLKVQHLGHGIHHQHPRDPRTREEQA